jgi:hypothetical protein
LNTPWWTKTEWKLHHLSRKRHNEANIALDLLY